MESYSAKPFERRTFRYLYLCKGCLSPGHSPFRYRVNLFRMKSTTSSVGRTGGTGRGWLSPSVRVRFTYRDVRQSAVRQPGKVQEREHLWRWLDDDPLAIVELQHPDQGSESGRVYEGDT